MNAYSLNQEFASGDNIALLGRKERHRLLRKNDISKAAEHVFALKGFYKATIQDIARQAQYAAGTVYLYFKDKDALYLHILEEKIRQFAQVLNLKDAENKTPGEKLEEFVYESLLFFEKNQDFFRIFVREESSWSIKSKIAKLPAVNKPKEIFIRAIKQAQDAGLIKDGLDAAHVNIILESIIISSVFRFWEEKKSLQEKERLDMSGMIMDLFLNGAKKN